MFGLSTFLGTLGTLGTLGIDRFVLGQPVLGSLKLITAGGFGLWYLVDLFLVGGIARRKNMEIDKTIVASL